MTCRSAIIVAHGQPSDPGPAEADLAALRDRIASLLPDWTLRSATLAAPGALETALAGLSKPRILPLFMADGWFTRVVLPRRIEAAGAIADIAEAFGIQPGFNQIVASIACEAAVDRGWSFVETALVLAAHGSGQSARPAEVARETRDHLAGLGFQCIRLGFIEENPRLAEAAGGLGETALCLPLFAAAGGHVRQDIPQALGEAGFRGELLEPVGLHPRMIAFIADAIRDGHSAKAASSS